MQLVCTRLEDSLALTGELREFRVVGLARCVEDLDVYRKAYQEFEFTSLGHVVSTPEKFYYLVKHSRRISFIAGA